MNRFDSMQLGSAKSEFCGKCGMHTEESNGCCHDAVQILKIDDVQQAASIAFEFKAPDILPVQLNKYLEVIIADNLSAVYSTDHSPPLSKQDTYLQNCVFRI